MAPTILFTALMLFGWTQSAGAEMTSDTFIQEAEGALSERTHGSPEHAEPRARSIQPLLKETFTKDKHDPFNRFMEDQRSRNIAGERPEPPSYNPMAFPLW